MEYNNIKDKIYNIAMDLGFADVGFTKPELTEIQISRFKEYIETKAYKNMLWMNNDKRLDPKKLLPSAKTAIMLSMSYANNQLKEGLIAKYATYEDYHIVISDKLKKITDIIEKETGAETKICVDTSPILEKALAENSGIGWQGRHTCIISTKFSGFTFLSSILTSLEIEADKPHKNHCGTCKKCIDACPTGALKDGKLNTELCIAYQTIENKEEQNEETINKRGTRIFGCDACLMACPWNRVLKDKNEVPLNENKHAHTASLLYYLNLDEIEFKKIFKNTPIERRKHKGFIKNVIIACGNSDNKQLISELEKFLNIEELASHAKKAIQKLELQGN